MLKGWLVFILFLLCFLGATDETVRLVSSLAEFRKKFATFDKVNVIAPNPKQQVPMNRKLKNIQSEIVNPDPARPTPLPDTSKPPLHSSIGFSVPSNIAKNPHPLLPHTASPPPLFFPVASPEPVVLPFAPKQPPFTGPSTSPYGSD